MIIRLLMILSIVPFMAGCSDKEKVEETFKEFAEACKGTVTHTFSYNIFVPSLTISCTETPESEQ